jgi:hypothetical protein
VFKEGRDPKVKRVFVLPDGKGMFVEATGWREHASIELLHVPTEIAEKVLRLLAEEAK